MADENIQYIGLIEWFDDNKGFGVISALMPESDKTLEIFIHHSNWRGKGRFYGCSAPHVFNIRKRVGKNGYEALKCKPFQGSAEQWQLIFRHRPYNIRAYDSKSSTADVLEKCISTISNDEEAQNFIDSAKSWHNSKPISNISDVECYLKGAKNIYNPILIKYLKDIVVSLLSLEQRLERFKKSELTLAYFSIEECLSFIDFISISDCKAISRVEPEKASTILMNKLDNALSNFNFELSFANSSSSICSNLQAIYEEYCNTTSDIESKQHYGQLINESVLENKRQWEDLCVSLVDNKNNESLRNRLNRLLHFPPLFNDKTKEILSEITASYLKKALSVEKIIWLMLNDGLAIDLGYINCHINEITESDFENICKSNEITEDFIIDFFKKYVSTGRLHKALHLIKEKPCLNTADIITFVKDKIKLHLSKLEEVIASLDNYQDLLSSEFVFDTTVTYLEQTRNIQPLIKQVNSDNPGYRNRINHIILNCHRLHPEWVDCNYLNAFEFSHIVPVTDDHYVSMIIQLYKNTSNGKWCMTYANKVGGSVKNSVETYLISTLTKQDYMTLWQDETCDCLPEGYLNDYFDDDESKYNFASSWLNTRRVDKELLSNILTSAVDEISNTNTQKAFLTKFYIYKFFVDVLKSSIDEHLNEDLTKLFRWALNDGLEISLSKEYIFSMFILFPEDIQVSLMKKIFACKTAGLIEFNLIDLYSLEDLNVDYLNEFEHPSINLSVSVIIESINSYAQKGRFLLGKELFSLVFKYAKKHSKELIRIGRFFDECTGKKYQSYPIDMKVTKSYVFSITDSRGFVWFIINFPYSASVVEDVKKITGRRYHPQYHIWFAPESSEEEVRDFAERYKLLIINKRNVPDDISKPLRDLLQGYDENQLKRDNLHLSTLKESEEQPPKGFLCEGRESQKSQDNVWWCIGHYPCSDCAMRTHTSKDWSKFTLLDFCKAFNLDVSEENLYGQFKTGSYALFLTVINKFNKLLERLYCRECGELLYPIDSNYSINGATTFFCVNDNCGQKGRQIYLNHCYSKKCRGVIDSRDAARCLNGLVICKECGTCCTTEMFRFRLERLMQVNSSYIPPDLVYKANNNRGHLNNEQYFCHQCGNQLFGYTEHAICPHCGTEIHYNSKLRNKR